MKKDEVRFSQISRLDDTEDLQKFAGQAVSLEIYDIVGFVHITALLTGFSLWKKMWWPSWAWESSAFFSSNLLFRLKFINSVSPCYHRS